MSEALKQALNALELEVIHYRNTGVGKTFLFAAFERVRELSCYQDKDPQPVFMFSGNYPLPESN